jgi:excinuclease ABC subunit C
MASVPTEKDPSSTDAMKLLRARVAKSPTDPGVYRWLDEEGGVLYVGKAKNLRARLRSYVAVKVDKNIGPWKLSLIERMKNVDWTVVSSELEALVLETNLIKEFRPKYNVLMKDDKSYVYVRVTAKDPYPTVEVVRDMAKDGALYFGPHLRAMDTRRALDMVQDLVQYRACKESLSVLNRGGDPSKLRPCLDYHIGQCCGLCAGTMAPEEYLSRIERLVAYFKGDYAPLIERAMWLMQQAAQAKQFERASHFRDTLQSLQTMAERQIVSDTSGEDVDVFGVALLSGAVHAVLLRKRGGKLIGEDSFSLMGRAEDMDEALEQLLPQYYEASPDLPDVVLVGAEFPSRGVLEELLSQRRGKKVKIRVPERGTKSQLLSLAERNAQEKALKNEASWEADARNTQEALTALQRLVKLEKEPVRIEGYDISHLGGTETVGSMVVAIDGKPRNDHYRSFTIRTLQEGDIDDYRSLREVLTRRLRHLVGGIKAEEQRWSDEGITVRKGKKADDVGECEFALVAEKEGETVAVAKVVDVDGYCELASLRVDPPYAEGPLASFLVRKAVASAKDKVYTIVEPALESSYAAIGFRPVQRAPKAFEGRVNEQAILMSCEPKDQKPDVSLSARPDLLVIDGGKGQLGVVVEVLKNWKLDIPVISLAKREEEVFEPGSSFPIPFPPDSPAKFLLMRLRDEAHRFANRHRKKRAWNTFVAD